VHGLQLVEVPHVHPVPPGRQGNGAFINERGERHVSQVKPLLSSTLH
jgi:hypothetical protein